MSEWAAGSVVLTHDIYDPALLAQAVSDYKTFLAITVVGRDAQETVVKFSRPEDARAPGEQVVREFLNYFLDLSVRALLSRGG